MNDTSANISGTQCIRGAMAAINEIVAALDLRLLGIFIIRFSVRFMRRFVIKNRALRDRVIS